MSDLTDIDIENILDCLNEQGYEYKLSKEELKKILKQNTKKSVISNITEEQLENDKINKSDNIEEETEYDISNINSTLENNEEDNEINSKIENEIENEINETLQDETENNINDLSVNKKDNKKDTIKIVNLEIDIDDIETEINNNIEKTIHETLHDTNNINLNEDYNKLDLDKLIQLSNEKLKKAIYKKDELKKKQTSINENLKNIRNKLEQNYNTILETQGKISDNYMSKLGNIRDKLKKRISEKNKFLNKTEDFTDKSEPILKNNNNRSKKYTIPPLNLNKIDKSNNHSTEKYTDIHDKLMIRTKLNNPPPPPQFQSYRPNDTIINHMQNNKYSNIDPENWYQSKYGQQNRYKSPQHRPVPPPPPSSRFQSPNYGPLSDRYNSGQYISPLDKYASAQYGSTTNRGSPYYTSITDKYGSPLLTPSRQYQNYERNNKFRPRSNSIYEHKTSDKYVDFDELCKKYEEKDDYNKPIEHEFVITVPPSSSSNAMELINNALDKFEREIYMDESKSEKSTLKSFFDKLKNYKKTPLPKYDKEEMMYYDSLSEEKKTKVDKLELKISQINNIKTPLRFRVLQSNLPLYNKSMIINKIEDLFSNKLMGGSEITKYSNWINSLLKVPFKKYKKLPIDVETSTDENIGDYLIDVKKTLDTAVYGHTKTKEQVIQIIAQWITNPNCIGNCIGIQGVMGNGKTTLVKNGIAKAIGRPFAFITLGGCSDSSFLEGHNYTYEGSMWGKIVDVLMECKCMNPVFYFDELDKVSETPKGEEIINSLIHLTDSSQNNQFADKYFNGVEFDLSKSLFIFSYNDITKINPILLDRLICIKTEAFELDDKIHIAQNYLLREIYEQLKIKEDTYKITDENIKYIIETYTNDEGGVRTLKKHLYNIFSKFNLLNLTKNDDSIKYTFNLDKDVLEKKEITNEIIDTFIKEKEKEKDEYYKTFYM